MQANKQMNNQADTYKQTDNQTTQAWCPIWETQTDTIATQPISTHKRTNVAWPHQENSYTRNPHTVQQMWPQQQP